MVAIRKDAPESVTEEETAPPQTEWPFTVRLKVPIEFGSQRIEEITLRRGQVRDLKGIRLGGDVPTESLITVAARLSGQPSAVIERLDQDDAGEILEAVLDFFGMCLSTGKRP
jgi:hypothetical protein